MYSLVHHEKERKHWRTQQHTNETLDLHRRWQWWMIAKEECCVSGDWTRLDFGENQRMEKHSL